jgi:hypothetical protein
LLPELPIHAFRRRPRPHRRHARLARRRSADWRPADPRPADLCLPGPRAGRPPEIRPQGRPSPPRFPRPIARQLSGAFSCPPRFHRHARRPRAGPEPLLHVKRRLTASPAPEPRRAVVAARPQRHPRSQLRLRLAIPGPLRKPPPRSSPCLMPARSGPATGQRPSARLSRPDRPYRPRPVQRPRPAYPAGAIRAGPGRPPRRRSPL